MAKDSNSVEPWDVAEAAARLDDLLNAAALNGLQMIRTPGERDFVVVPRETWERFVPNTRDFLLHGGDIEGADPTDEWR